MGLVSSLLVVFFSFCLLMAGVLAFCLRERRKIDGIGNPAKRDANTGEIRTGEIRPQDHIASPDGVEQDSRVAIVLFGSIIAGALLALITAYLVFGRTW
jgi:hypothetical protein